MARFIHTADWQIGKPYLRIKDEQKRFKLRQERFNAISRIKEVVRMQASQFVVIAGDLFDSPAPSSSCVIEVLESIGEMEVPIAIVSLGANRDQTIIIEDPIHGPKRALLR